jgi:hypothetical protein
LGADCNPLANKVCGFGRHAAADKLGTQLRQKYFKPLVWFHVSSYDRERGRRAGKQPAMSHDPPQLASFADGYLKGLGAKFVIAGVALRPILIALTGDYRVARAAFEEAVKQWLGAS